MNQLLLVAVGGGLGAVARWTIGGLVLRHTLDWRFPLSTFIVNAGGCLAAGLLAGMAAKLDAFWPGARLFLFTGLLGGFTTFSAFGIDAAHLLRRGDVWLACAYALASVTAGILGVLAGMALVPDQGTSP